MKRKVTLVADSYYLIDSPKKIEEEMKRGYRAILFEFLHDLQPEEYQVKRESFRESYERYRKGLRKIYKRARTKVGELVRPSSIFKFLIKNRKEIQEILEMDPLYKTEKSEDRMMDILFNAYVLRDFFSEPPEVVIKFLGRAKYELVGQTKDLFTENPKYVAESLVEREIRDLTHPEMILLFATLISEAGGSENLSSSVREMMDYGPVMSQKYPLLEIIARRMLMHKVVYNAREYAEVVGGCDIPLSEKQSLLHYIIQGRRGERWVVKKVESMKRMTEEIANSFRKYGNVLAVVGYPSVEMVRLELKSEGIPVKVKPLIRWEAQMVEKLERRYSPVTLYLISEVMTDTFLQGMDITAKAAEVLVGLSRRQ